MPKAEIVGKWTRHADFPQPAKQCGSIRASDAKRARFVLGNMMLSDGDKVGEPKEKKSISTMIEMEAECGFDDFSALSIAKSRVG
jgi:hypothetical protein